MIKKLSPGILALLFFSVSVLSENEINITSGPPTKVPLSNDTPAFLFQDENGKLYYQDADSEYTPYSDDNKEHSWRFFSASTLDDIYSNYTKALKKFRYNNPDATSGQIYRSVEVPLHDQATVQNTTRLCNQSGLSEAIMPSLLADGKAVSGYDNNNFCDLTGIWIDPDTGYWYGPVHDELFGNIPRFDAIELAVSKDKGKKWSIIGPIITSPYSITGELGANGGKVRESGFPNETYHYGGGDPRLFVDYASGYFYIFYTSRIMNIASDSKRHDGFNNAMWLHVARSKIREKMTPGSWEKYIDGKWDKSGNKKQAYGLVSNNGSEANLVPVGINSDGYDNQLYDPNKKGKIQEQGIVGSALKVINISWNSYLGLYIGTPEHRSGDNNDKAAPLVFYATDDLSTQRWFKLGELPSYKNTSWYRFMVESGSASQQAFTGKNFRSYCYYGCTKEEDEGGEYVSITLKTTTPYLPVSLDVIWTLKNKKNKVLGDKTGWRLQPTGDGFYRLISAKNNTRALSVFSKNKSLEKMRSWGTTVESAPLDSSIPSPENFSVLAQQWLIQPVFTTDDRIGKNIPTPFIRLINRLNGLTLSFTDSASVVTAPQRDWQCREQYCLDNRSPDSQLLMLIPE